MNARAKGLAEVTVKDIHWLAGFIEGEGCFYWHTKEGTVSASQKEREPLEKIEKLLGGHIYFRKRGIAERSTSCHIWMLTGRRAIGLMMTLYPLMSSRRQRKINEIIAIWKTKLGLGIRNKIKTHCPKGHPYDADNTRMQSSQTGYRHRNCKTCERENQRTEKYKIVKRQWSIRNKDKLKEYHRRWYEQSKVQSRQGS